MAFLSSLSDFQNPSNSFEMTDRLDSAFPSTAELCKAVSASLGLDTASSPISNLNQSLSGNGYSLFGPDAESRSELKSTRDVQSEDGILATGTDRDEYDFEEVRQDTDGCVEPLVLGDIDSAQSVARAPAISRFVQLESNLFTNQVGEVSARAQARALSPPKPFIPPSANPSIYRESPAVWRAYSGEAEPEKPGGYNMLCKYCNYGQASNGSGQRCHCVWYSSGEKGGKNDTQAAMAQEYGQLEIYQSATLQGHSGTYTIKTEPPVWMDWTERRFR